MRQKTVLQAVTRYFSRYIFWQIRKKENYTDKMLSNEVKIKTDNVNSQELMIPNMDANFSNLIFRRDLIKQNLLSNTMRRFVKKKSPNPHYFIIIFFIINMISMNLFHIRLWLEIYPLTYSPVWKSPLAWTVVQLLPSWGIIVSKH